MERLRKHWRDQYLTVVEELPTSEYALREAVFREANALPPCKETDGGRSAKVGSRDAAIWLSAIDYARQNPNENVYFVSSNTRDFGDGAAYKSPMDADVADLGDRFRHLTKMDDVITRFAEPTDTDEELVAKTLRAASVLKAAKRRLGGDERLSECCFLAGFSGGELEIGAALSWVTMKAQFHSLRDVRTYRIGEHEWCTAVVRWDLAGTAFISPSTTDTATAGCSWMTSVIFRPDPHDPRLTVLRHDPTRALNQDEFEKLDPSKAPAITVSMLSEYLTSGGDKLPLPRPARISPPPPPAWTDTFNSVFFDRELKAVEVANQSAIARRLNALLEEADEE
ncbi:PIN domain-containing protein [Streptomyces griseorubiginosus]|uniref:PIN domain-containing protein n=1 Tax=Streptomyces griseorubiginosus TaxID=67304 RepID=UPI0033A42E42